MINNVICFDHCDLIVIKDILKCLKSVDVPVSEAATLGFFLGVLSTADLNRRWFGREKLR